MDGKMLEFPLCCLNYPTDDRDKIGMIISYFVYERSRIIESNIYSRIQDLLDRGKMPIGFIKSSNEHCRLLLAADELNITIGNISNTKDAHYKLYQHRSNYEAKYGKDSFCQIGKKLCFETRDGKFPYRQFAVLCAVQSILGKKKKYKRITKDRIRYAMLGYKSKSVAQQEKVKKENLLTDRQLGSTIEILHSKKFFSKFTYANRQTFYSTRLNDSELIEAVKSSKVYWATKKLSLMDKQGTEDIKSELGKLKLIRFDSLLKSERGL